MVDYHTPSFRNHCIDEITLIKRLVILGSGESGTGTAILAKMQGWEVFVSDFGTIADKYKSELIENEIDFEEGKHSEALILNATEIVKSPGIPDTVPIVKKAMEQHIPIISEIEFAGRYTQAKIICISGTNGKTTTTSLLYHILNSSGLNVGLGGNIGQSFARQVATKNFDYYVLELSSFQLDGNVNFKSHISILTNITPDHLDRYDYQVEKYAASKFRLLLNQNETDYFIYCEEDPLTKQYFPQNIKSTTLSFGLQKTEKSAAWLDNGTVHIDIKKKSNEHIQQQFKLEEMTIKGIHNTYNSMAAAVAASLLDVKSENLRESLSTFEAIEHRLETVANVNGITYINDSKATNVNSVWFALESMDRPVIWIAGGVDKGNNYNEIKSLVKEKVKLIICLGIDNRKIHQAFQGDVDMIINTLSAREAVHVAHHLAESGDVVLLSPACASFDLYENYEDRGRQFKMAVHHL